MTPWLNSVPYKAISRTVDYNLIGILLQEPSNVRRHQRPCRLKTEVLGGRGMHAAFRSCNFSDRSYSNSDYLVRRIT